MTPLSPTTSTDDQADTYDPLRLLLRWALGLTALITLLLGFGYLEASSSPDEIGAGLEWVMLAMIISFFTIPVWLVVGVLALIRLVRRVAH